MKPHQKLTLRSTLWMGKVTVFAMLLIISSITLLYNEMQPFENVRNISFPMLISGVLIFIASSMIKTEVEGRNIGETTSWAQTHYGINLNSKQALEMVRFGTCEFGPPDNMIVLCLIEKKGKFSLHQTRELEIFKETE